MDGWSSHSKLFFCNQEDKMPKLQLMMTLTLLMVMVVASALFGAAHAQVNVNVNAGVALAPNVHVVGGVGLSPNVAVGCDVSGNDIEAVIGRCALQVTNPDRQFAADCCDVLRNNILCACRMRSALQPAVASVIPKLFQECKLDCGHL